MSMYMPGVCDAPVCRLRVCRSIPAKLIAGKLPPAKVAAVKGWCEAHREALLEDWRRARLRLHPVGRYDSS